MSFFKSIFLLFMMQITTNLYSQSFEVPLWNTAIPNEIKNESYKENAVYEDTILTKVSQVSIPTLTVFKPKNPNGTAVIICPGGGYLHLSINKEGYKVAEWLNSLGITAIVLKYRLPSDVIMTDKSIGPLQDAQEAMRYVRRKADVWGLKDNKIGIMGFSAGGHLASTLATKYDEKVYNVSDKTSAKPNFTILVYPVISMDETITHKGSKNNLLGKNPNNELVSKFSSDKNVTLETAPTFLVHASDDKSVVVENSINYYLALKKNKIASELHIYEKGGHGFGLGKNDTSQFWTKDCQNWLITNFLN